MPSTDSIRIIALINPFSREVLEARADAGMTLREIVGENASEQVLAFVNGEPVRFEDWAQTMVEDGDIVNLINVPAGSGNDMLRLVGMVAIAWFAWYAAPWLAGAGAWGSAGYTAHAAGVAAGTIGGGYFASTAFWAGATFAAGSMAVNALIPPPMPKMAGEPTRLQSLTGTRNNLAPYAPVPSIYGTHKTYPPFAALPYTEIIGNEQYFNALYCVGLGEYTINATDLHIGDTRLLDYEDAEVVITDSPVFDSIVEEQLAVTLRQNAAPPADGESAIRTSATTAKSLSVDIQFPAGLIHTSPDGDRNTAFVDFRLEYRAVGAGTWLNVRNTDWEAATRGSQTVAGEPVTNTSPLTVNGLWAAALVVDPAGTLFRVSARSTDGKRVGIKWTVTEGQYEVRLTRVRTARINHADQWEESSRWSRLTATMVWTALRTYRTGNAVVVTPNEMTFVRVRLKATEALSGIVDSMNVITTRKLPTYDGNVWSAPVAMGAGSLPWAFVDILKGQANARPVNDQRINLDEMMAWSAECAAAGRTYDEVLDYQTSVFEALRRVASVGRAGIGNRNGQWTVIREQATPVPVQFFTPRNSHGFTGQKQLVRVPHALKVRFVSREADWQEDEIIVYDDNYTELNATYFEVLDLRGITNPSIAWKAGRYHLAALRLRPEVYSFATDVEHIVCERGDYIRVAHDIPLWGTGTARIKSITGDVIVLDDKFTIGIETYRMRIRKNDGQMVLITVTASQGLEVDTFTRTVTNEGTWNNINVDDLVMLGTIGSESVMLLVTGVEPGADLSAEVICVDAAPEILSADTGPIPPFDPGITLPPDPRLIFPPKPYNVQVFSGDNTQTRLQDGSSSPRMLVTWDYPGAALSAFPGTTATVRYREEDVDGVFGEYKYITGIPVAEGSAIVLNIEIGSRYKVQVMAISRHDAPSGYTNPVYHIVAGSTFGITAPPTPTTVSASGRVKVICYFPESWDENADVAYVEFGKSNTSSALDINEIVRVAVPTSLTDVTAMGVFLLDVGLTRYFFARIVTIPGRYSAWTTGVAGTAFGLSARYVILVTEGIVFSYDNKTGTPVLIGPSAIDMTVLRNGVAGPVTWEAWDGQGVPITPISNILTISGAENLTAVMPASLFGAIPNNEHITVRVTSEDIYDETTIIKIQSGRDGAAGDAIAGGLSNPTHVVPTAEDGTGGNVATAGGNFRVWLGLGEITTGNGVVYTVVGGADALPDHAKTQSGLRMAINKSTGAYTLTIPTAWTTDSEVFDLKAAYDTGTEIIDVVLRYTIVKAKAGAEGPPGEGALEGYVRVDGPAAWVRNKDNTTWNPTATTTDLDWTFDLDGLPVARISRRVTRTTEGILSVSTTTHPSVDLNLARVQISVVGDGTRAVTVTATYNFEGHVKAVAQAVTASLSGEDGADGANGVNLFLLDTAGILSTVTGTFSAGAGVVFGSQLSVYKRRVTLEEVGLAPGDVVSASARLAYTAAGYDVRLRMQFYDGAGTSIGLTDGPAVTSTTLVRAVAENKVIPANTAAIQLYARVGGGTGTVSIDRGMVNRGPVAAQYSPPSRGGISEVTIEDFATGIDPVLVHAGPKPAGSHLGSDLVLWTTDGQLYRWTSPSGPYTAAVPAVEVSGLLSSEQIASIVASKVSGQLTSDQIASIVASKLTGTIVSTQIADDAITTPKINALAITANEIAADAVIASKIDAGAVNADKIAANSITAVNAALSDLVVTEAKIANLAVGTAKIKNLAVETAKIADLAVTDAKIGTITANKITTGTLSAGITLSNYIIVGTSGNIRSGKLTYASIGNGWWLGLDSGTPKFHIGFGGDHYLRWTGSALETSKLVVAGGIISNTPLDVNAARIHTGGGRTAPFVIYDIAGNTFSALYSPSYGSGHYHKRVAYMNVDILFSITIQIPVSNDEFPGTVSYTLQNRVNGDTWGPIATLGEAAIAATPQQVTYIHRYTTPNAWNYLDFRVLAGGVLVGTTIRTTVFINNANKAPAASADTSGQTSTTPVAPIAWTPPPGDPSPLP